MNHGNEPVSPVVDRCSDALHDLCTPLLWVILKTEALVTFYQNLEGEDKSPAVLTALTEARVALVRAHAFVHFRASLPRSPTPEEDSRRAHNQAERAGQYAAKSDKVQGEEGQEEE